MALQILEKYGNFVENSPLFAQMATAGVIVTLGDILAQTVVEKSRFSRRRLFVMMFCGCFYFGPCIGAWLMFLNQFDVPVIYKVCADQAIFTPTFLSGFFLVQLLLMGKTFLDWQRKIKFELFGIVKKSIMLWGPVQFINFNYVPFQYRMLLIQIISLFWNTYLSVRANKPTETGETLPV